jgi:hypothetical protein
VQVNNHQYGGTSQFADKINNVYGGVPDGTPDLGAEIRELIGRVSAAGLEPRTTTAAVEHARTALAGLDDAAAAPEPPAVAMSRVHQVLAGVAKAAPLATAAATIASALVAGQ